MKKVMFILLVALLAGSEAHGPTMMVREAPTTSDPRIEAAVEFARLIGAETGFASMYWPDRLVWTQYVNARQDAVISAAERALGYMKTT